MIIKYRTMILTNPVLYERKKNRWVFQWYVFWQFPRNVGQRLWGRGRGWRAAQNRRGRWRTAQPGRNLHSPTANQAIAEQLARAGGGEAAGAVAAPPDHLAEGLPAPRLVPTQGAALPAEVENGPRPPPSSAPEWYADDRYLKIYESQQREII